VCGVGQVRLCMCVSYEERRVAVGLLERVSVWCWAGPSVCVCVCVLYEEHRVAVDLLQRVSVVLGRSVCVCVCRTLNAGSCRSAGQSECVVLGRSVCVCVSYAEC